MPFRSWRPLCPRRGTALLAVVGAIAPLRAEVAAPPPAGGAANSGARQQRVEMLEEILVPERVGLEPVVALDAIVAAWSRLSLVDSSVAEDTVAGDQLQAAVAVTSDIDPGCVLEPSCESFGAHAIRPGFPEGALELRVIRGGGVAPRFGPVRVAWCDIDFQAEHWRPPCLPEAPDVVGRWRGRAGRRNRNTHRMGAMR